MTCASDQAFNAMNSATENQRGKLISVRMMNTPLPPKSPKLRVDLQARVRCDISKEPARYMHAYGVHMKYTHTKSMQRVFLHCMVNGRYAFIREGSQIPTSGELSCWGKENDHSGVCRIDACCALQLGEITIVKSKEYYRRNEPLRISQVSTKC